MRRSSKIPHETSKQRALRIPLSFVRTIDPIQKWKWIFTAGAILCTAGYLAFFLFSTTKRHAPFSPGPIASVHATWEHQCSACHVDFAPTRSDSIKVLSLVGKSDTHTVSAVGQSPHAAIDAKCQACHASAPHHPKRERFQDGVSCSSCHLDHQGKHFDIARPADQHCTRCHSDIGAHREGESPIVEPALENQILAFATEDEKRKTHPEFRSLKSDPGNIKFNHSLHMTAGIPAFDSKSEGQKLVTLESLPKEFVAKYRREDQPELTPSVDNTYFVQLECNSCHHPVKTPSKSIVSSSSTIADKSPYMAPISFERDCKACHRLTYEPQTGDAEQTLQHGLAPKQIRESLFTRYVAEELKANPPKPAEPLVPRRPIPGRSIDDVRKRPGFQSVQSRVAAAERFLQDSKTCCKCHTLGSSPAGDDPALLPPVLPSNIPERWFRFARFDHSSHGAVACKECHSKAYDHSANQEQRKSSLEISCAADAMEGPIDNKVVMIAGREVCMKCHSPRSSDGSRGGARHACMECHQYHGGDARLGITDGSLHEPSRNKSSIDDFLRGSRFNAELKESR